jgi:hypothetical protein
MKRFAVVLIVAALAPTASAGAFPEQPGDQYAKRQTGCASALTNAISGAGGAHADPGALANGLEAFTGLCLP